MPVVFKDENIKPFVLLKEGTEFYFKATPEVKRKASVISIESKDKKFQEYFLNLFRMSLYDWKGEGVVDEKGNQIPFSEELRDALVNEAELDSGEALFTVNDVYDFVNHITPKTKGKKK